MLKSTFEALMANYPAHPAASNEYWNEIVAHYTHKKRYYHNLTHLQHLLQNLTDLRADIQDWEAILWALYYHDLVYNPLKSDNEAQSARIAVQRMTALGVAPATIARCENHIVATQKHHFSTDPDTNLFTDADLAILGQPWEVYVLYGEHIRKEYAIYPDLLYYPGRKKVLQHFLSMERIFKTAWFYDRFEAQARENLRRELG